MFKTRYRIVEFREGCYRLEIKPWWFPFWVEETPGSWCRYPRTLENYLNTELKFKPRVIKEL